MEITINAVFCIVLANAIYWTMIFLVDAVNAMIDGINEGEGFIDNRHYLLSWALVLLVYFVKSSIFQL
tara:strand:+ start:644 stop:847 length:204 start_codon:yes stop_codon:yes gene_type:complete